MVFVACGLNHNTAPIALRERVALSKSSQMHYLDRLIHNKAVDEAAILSTCNRTEVYCSTEAPHQLMDWFSEEYALSLKTLKPHFYLHQGFDAVRHSLRVASGLDSMMLGEPQVLGQMKSCYQQACEQGLIKSKLGPIFQYVFSASKRIRHQSGIAKNPVSIAYASVQLLLKSFKDLKSAKVLLIGSGETSTLVAKYLQKEGASQFLIASRTLDNAQKLAEQFQGEKVAVTEIPQRLIDVDIVISATTCPLPFIDKAMVQEAMKHRNNKPLFLLDLAVPRDIDGSVSELEGITLYNIDALQHLVHHGMAERQRAAIEAESLVQDELDKYERWYRSLAAKDLVCAYREEMHRMSHQELKKVIAKLHVSPNQEDLLQAFCEKLVNKLTHLPTLGLKKMALDNRVDLLDFSRYLLNSSYKENTHEEIA